MATIAPPRPTLVTDEEYLARERDPDLETRAELLHGVVTMMPGGTPVHANLPTQISGITFARVRDSGCTTFSSVMKVRILGAGYLYPDLSFACDPRFEGGDVLLNPLSIVEVLSPTTEHRDRTAKFDAYASVPSLGEIVLAATDERRIEVYRRDGDGWRLRVFRPGEVARLLVGDAELPLDALYANFDRLSAPENASEEPTDETPAS